MTKFVDPIIARSFSWHLCQQSDSTTLNNLLGLKRTNYSKYGWEYRRVDVITWERRRIEA